MSLNMNGILSNAKAQGQKIFNYAKSGIIEESLLGDSISKAINTATSSAKDNYDDVVKGINLVKKDMNIPNDPSGLLKEARKISKDKDGSIMGIGKSMTEEQSNQVKDIASMRMVKKNNGLMSDDNMKTYDGILKTTKGIVAGNTAKNMGEQYFINPVKDLVKANKSGDKKSAKKALNKVVVRGGSVAGAIGGGAILASSGNNEEMMRY